MKQLLFVIGSHGDAYESVLTCTFLFEEEFLLIPHTFFYHPYYIKK